MSDHPTLLPSWMNIPREPNSLMKIPGRFIPVTESVLFAIRVAAPVYVFPFWIGVVLLYQQSVQTTTSPEAKLMLPCVEPYLPMETVYFMSC